MGRRQSPASIGFLCVLSVEKSAIGQSAIANLVNPVNPVEEKHLPGSQGNFREGQEHRF